MAKVESEHSISNSKSISCIHPHFFIIGWQFPNDISNRERGQIFPSLHCRMKNGNGNGSNLQDPQCLPSTDFGIEWVFNKFFRSENDENVNKKQKTSMPPYNLSNTDLHVSGEGLLSLRPPPKKSNFLKIKKMYQKSCNFWFSSLCVCYCNCCGLQSLRLYNENINNVLLILQGCREKEIKLF